MTALGVDWASGCWVVVAVDDGRVTITAEPTMCNIWAAYDADPILVDVPIGLPETPGRECDAAAAARLGGRHGSVFAVPCRAAVEADGYDTAREANGGSLGSQSWGFVPQIREVDCFLDAHPDAEACVYESHPEVCYAAFAEDAGVTLGSKRDSEGLDDRLAVLEIVDEPVATQVREFVEARRHGAKWHHRIQSGRLDDVLDAAVLALTARRGSDAFGVLPEDRRVEDRQVIVYPE